MSDVYILDLAGIPGEALVEGYKDKITLTGWSHNVAQPVVADPSNTKRTSGRPNHGTLNVSKTLDISSCKLIDYCNQAKVIATLKLTVAQENGGVLLPYLVVDCTDVLVSNFSYGAGGEVPRENINFDYSKITWTYTQQATPVSKAGNDSCVWDRATNMPK